MRSKRFGVSALALGVALMLSAAVRADDLKPDPVHSSVVFFIHHFSAGYVAGTFEGPQGSIAFDPSDPAKDSFDLHVKSASIDTRNAKRNQDLEGPDFFDVKQYPEISFKSTKVEAAGDNQMNVTGDLTLHGVTKSITVPMTMTGIGKGMKGEQRVGFQTEFKINRTDFGMSADPGVIGEEVRLIVSIEAVKS